ncbi:hypothetical protein F0L74_13260 [Chitinophaga agrisoli]|uniref:Uncharacterized protein n=1 Tax=Chitinophaga agrisoli TaxID=2607653 RepID=A0A5B2VXV6_9BACT|nr:hypothetical protein [Chitinophaga agrisoli]KAA2243458.1 hypothetical protein F0L74_13260 [Chitinophaga agrisoli]
MNTINEHMYPVFVAPANFDEEQENFYEKAINWMNENRSHPNVLLLSQKDVYILNAGASLDIINEEIDGMLGPGEDDWIVSPEEKLRVFERLSSYVETISSGREKEILQDMLRLLGIAIKTNKIMYITF